MVRFEDLQRRKLYLFKVKPGPVAGHPLHAELLNMIGRPGYPPTPEFVGLVITKGTERDYSVDPMGVEVPMAFVQDATDHQEMPFTLNLNKPGFWLSAANWMAKSFPLNQNLLAIEQMGRQKSGIPAEVMGKIAELSGHPGEERRMHMEEVADRGRPGDVPSRLRRRAEVEPEPEVQEAAAAAGPNPGPPEAPAEPDAKRRRTEGGNLFKDLVDKTVATVKSDPRSALQTLFSGYDAAAKAYNAKGGKAKRGPNPWTILIQTVYKELKEKDPNVTLAMAVKEASRRKNMKSAT
jgi:hypothetical protein